MFFSKIGFGTKEFADKFKDLGEVFTANGVAYFYKKILEEKEIPVQPRKYIMKCVDDMRRGLLTFEYLNRRIIPEPKKKKPNMAGGQAKGGAGASKGGKK